MPISDEKLKDQEDYAVTNVTVKDASGKEIAVTKNADGTYSFIQPDGKVTIEPEFTEQQPDKLAFTDVAQSDYYADAVAWAKANGITSGTSATTFSPADDCLRAQIITFLYRAYNK